MLRYGALIAGAFAAFPASAQQMSAAEARHFVVGKLYSYQCFEGTRGAGRIAENGSVAGTIQFRGNGSTRYAMLPHNTLYVVGDRICATVKGVPFQPCFNLIKTGANSFRGSVSGLGFAYCDFVRRDRPVVASAAPASAPRPDARAEAEAKAAAGDHGSRSGAGSGRSARNCRSRRKSRPLQARPKTSRTCAPRRIDPAPVTGPAANPSFARPAIAPEKSCRSSWHARRACRLHP